MRIALEVLRLTYRQLVPQQRLGRHDDQRLAERAQHLATQDMEIIGWRRDVGDLDIAFRTQLQEALQTRRTMFRPLPFIAMRQQADEPVGAQPFGFRRCDILVEDDLRAIGEVAKLRFPQHQALGVGQRIAIFKAQHAIFGQGAIQHLEPAMGHGRQRDIFLLGILVDPDRVALAERATTGILSRQSHAIAFRQERAEGQRLARRPVEIRA